MFCGEVWDFLISFERKRMGRDYLDWILFFLEHVLWDNVCGEEWIRSKIALHRGDWKVPHNLDIFWWIRGIPCKRYACISRWYETSIELGMSYNLVRTNGVSCQPKSSSTQISKLTLYSSLSFLNFISAGLSTLFVESTLRFSNSQLSSKRSREYTPSSIKRTLSRIDFCN